MNQGTLMRLSHSHRPSPRCAAGWRRLLLLALCGFGILGASTLDAHAQGADALDAQLAAEARQMDDETLVRTYLDCFDACQPLLREIQRRGDSPRDILAGIVRDRAADSGLPDDRLATYEAEFARQEAYAQDQRDDSLLPLERDEYVQLRAEAERWDDVVSSADALSAIGDPGPAEPWPLIGGVDAVGALWAAQQSAVADGRPDVAQVLEQAAMQLEETRAIHEPAYRWPGRRNATGLALAALAMGVGAAVYVTRRQPRDGDGSRNLDPEPSPIDSGGTQAETNVTKPKDKIVVEGDKTRIDDITVDRKGGSEAEEIVDLDQLEPGDTTPQEEA